MKMNDTNNIKRPVQIDMSVDLLRKIDRLAHDEALCRAAWCRRTLNEAVKAAEQPDK
jgi:hypothetical protein